jgi:hypothetical protein
MSLIEGDRRPPWVAAFRGRLAVLGVHAALAALALIGGPAGRAGALVGVCLVAFLSYRARRVRLFALTGTGAATAGALLLVAARAGDDAGPAPVRRLAAGAEVLGSVLLLPAVLIAVCLSVTLLGRALRRPAWWGWVVPGSNVLPPPSVLDQSGRPFPGDALPTPRPDRDLERPPAGLGICASGGGIRSAAVTLGALQSLRTAGLLCRARYLVAVSGGGFTAGAFQLAMQDLPTGDRHGTVVTDPEEVFREGSVEEDHVRRHGKYVADSGAEWVEALGAVLRGAGASLALLAGAVCVAGVVLGEFYRRTAVASFDYAYPFTPGAAPQAPALPAPPDAVLVAAAVPLLLGVLVWLVNIALMSFAIGTGRAGRLVVVGAFALAGLVLMLGSVVPLVVWGGTRAVWWVDSISSINAAQLVTGGAAGTVTLAYLGSLNSILWRGRKRIAGVGRLGRRLTRRLPGGLGQRVTVWAVLIAIGALYATLLGAVVRSSSQHPPHWFVIAVCVGFVLVTALVDETWMSLHWFYRRRLMTAFAVRRVHLGPDSDAALPYDFEREATPLSAYGARREGFPQVIFSAAAHLSGADRSPPGRNAVSFSFSGDWVGGPQVGYVRTDALEKNLGSNLRMDLTLQTAVAVSGAAFASSMGVQARAYQTLLALSNARLGTWLPNPAWLYRRCPAGDCEPDWTAPRLPRVRRISYLLREVLGRYDQHDRLLLVTDGGHYDNTGLVELLRHRCRTAVLIDSSGDPPPFAQALGRAIGLARAELGVTIELDDQFALVPGGGCPLEPASELSGVNGRLSRSVVLTGTVRYPSPFCAPGEDVPSAVGRLVVAKLALTADMPYDVLAFAAAHPVFPFDATSDQWFDEAQFNGYQGIGRVLGEKAAAAVREAPVTVPGSRVPRQAEVRLT